MDKTSETVDYISCLGCNQTLGIGQVEYCPACRRDMSPERMWERANQWPASERGDPTEHEGWEEMRRWELAHGIIETSTNDDHPLAGQLDWLKRIRKKKNFSG